MNFTTIPPQEQIDKTIAALRANGINALFVKTQEEAKAKVFELVPLDAEIMTMTSITLETLGIPSVINESGKYNSVRSKFKTMDRATQGPEMQKLGAAPLWTIGSVHAVTEDGAVMIASQTGSQLPSYAYGSSHVVWVVGVQKIVPTLEDGMKRIYEHSLPLESERAKKAYGVAGSSVNKVLIVNKEIQPGRITLIFVNEVLGF